MNAMKTRLLAFALLPLLAAAQPPPGPSAPADPETTAPVRIVSTQSDPGRVDISLRNEAEAALNRGFKWLAARQKENGAWSNEDFPALTGLPLWALAMRRAPEYKPRVDKAVEFLMAHVQPDGSIYRPREGAQGGGLANYNTAICMTALHEAGDPALIPAILKARRFMANAQHLGGDLYHGGMGYDPTSGRAYADLNNTVMGLEAMRLTERVEDFRPAGEARVDLDWQAVTQFLARVQNDSSAGPAEAGGFAYRPDESKAGIATGTQGRIVFRSYGSMTYAGMLSLIYARVSRDDLRVRSAFDWTVRHWSLDENPGMGSEGLYYFLNVLTKAMNAYGRERITLADGQTLAWRSEIVRRLVNLQRVDPDTGEGFWMNETGRWWESDPVLTTAYTLIALQAALAE
jgi:squalene-hopene/tetraprenyl-beta-curcumene cyclase